MEFGKFNNILGLGYELSTPEVIDINTKLALSEYSDLNKYKPINEIYLEVTLKEESKHPTTNYTLYVGYSGFEKAFDEVEKEMPLAAQYRELLTKIAQHESGFKSFILNKEGAPAYGYFLFMEDGKKYHNIQTYSGLSIEDFKKDPKAQIKAAIKLAESFKHQFTQDDINKAQAKGISLSGMIGGAWLGGVGGVRKVLNETGNPSDRHWSKTGAGSDVVSCMQRYNNL